MAKRSEPAGDCPPWPAATAATEEYTVTLNYNGHGVAEGEPDTQTCETTDSRVDLPTPTAKGYAFVGWHADEACTTASDLISQRGQSPMARQTLAIGDSPLWLTTTEAAGQGGLSPMAKRSEPAGDCPPWLAATAATEGLTVTLNYNGHGVAEGEPETLTLTTTDGTVDLPTPTAKGYTFVGWCTDEACTTAPDPNTPITSDLTLYAKWTANTNTITFDDSTAPGHRNTQIAPQNVTTGERIVPPSMPEPLGYQFMGWYTDVDLTTAFDASEPVCESLTLYAKWLPLVEQSEVVPADTYTMYYGADPIEVATGTVTVEDVLSAINSGALSTTSPERKAVGVTPVYYYALSNPAADGSQELLCSGVQNISITKRTLEVTPQDNYVAKGSDPVDGGLQFGEEVTTTETDPDTGETRKVTRVEKGFVGGENESYLSGTPVFHYSYNSSEDGVGKYQITVSGYTSNDYDIVYRTGKLVVMESSTLEALNNAGRLAITSFVYDGQKKVPVISLYDEKGENPQELKLGVHYLIKEGSVSFATDANGVEKTADNDWVEWYVLTIQGTNLYTGEATLRWRIDKATQDAPKPGEGYSSATESVVVSTSSDTDGASGAAGDGTQDGSAAPVQATHTVTFVANGHGTDPEAETVADGGKVAAPDAPTAAGYTFLGWYADPNGEGDPYDFATPVTTDLTLYAQWRAQTFTMSFDANGHGVAPLAQTVVAEATGVRPADPVVAGFVFGGWYADASCTTRYDFSTPVTTDVALYAGWAVGTHTVAFDMRGYGTAPAAQQVSDGKTATEPTTPTADGFVFGGWYTDAVCTKLYDFSTPVTADMTLYAKWTSETKVVNAHTVTFNANDHGTTPVAQLVVDGERATQPNDLAATGYAFGGWYTDAAFTKAYNFDAPVTGDLTLHAKWTEVAACTVSFNLMGHGKDDDKPEDQGVMPGATALLPDSPTDSNYVFCGWYVGTENGGQITLTDKPYSFSTPVTASLTLYAKWQEKSSTQTPHAVSFQVKGGATGYPQAQTVVSGGVASEPEEPEATDQVFDGWYSDEACTTRYDFNTPVSANLTLYAQWTSKLSTVTFDMRGYGSVSPQTVVSGQAATAPETPTAEGFSFGGWYTDESCSVAYDFAAPVTANLTLYAKWTSATVPTRDVYFYLGTPTGATGFSAAPAAQTVAEGGKAVAPADPTWTGHSFAGWYTDVDHTNRFDFAEPITQTTHLYALWTDGPHTVSFSANGYAAAGMPESQLVDHSDVAEKPGDPQADGLVFAGWYTNAACTGDAYDFSASVTGGLTLFAKWTPATYTISFGDNGVTPLGTWPQDQATTYGGRATEPGFVPVSESQNFAGWYASATGEGDARYDFAATRVTGNLTLYARWAPKEYRTVSFETNGHGTAPESQSVEVGHTAENPGRLSETGWVFEGWFADAALTQAFAFGTPIEADTVVYAKWKRYFPEDYLEDKEGGPKVIISMGGGTHPVYELSRLDADGNHVVLAGGSTGVLTYVATNGEQLYVRKIEENNYYASEYTPFTADNKLVGTPVLRTAGGTAYAEGTMYDELTTPITYTGRGQTLSVLPYRYAVDVDRWEIVEGSDNLTQTNAGTYSVMLMPKAGYSWLDGTAESDGTALPKTLTWTILRAQMLEVPLPQVNKLTGRITVSSSASGGTTYPDGLTPYVYEYRIKGQGDDAWVALPADGFVAVPGVEYEFRIAATANTYAGSLVALATYTPGRAGDDTDPTGPTDPADQTTPGDSDGGTPTRPGTPEDGADSDKNATTFVITYDLNGGTYNGSSAPIYETHELGSVISVHEAPEREGYVFDYWKGSSYQPGDNYTVVEDHTFVAQWKEAAPSDDDDEGDVASGRRSLTSPHLSSAERPKSNHTTKLATTADTTYPPALPLCLALLGAALILKRRRS